MAKSTEDMRERGQRGREGEEGVRGEEQEREWKRKGGQEWRGHESASPWDRNHYCRERLKEREGGAEEVERLWMCTSPHDRIFLRCERGRGEQEKEKEKEEKN